jgi:hypothetical protein
MRTNIISTALSLACLPFTLIASENPIRARLENEMYERSGGALSRSDYNKLINPFLNKAENELKAVQFCEKNQNQNCTECERYFSTLLDYNVACFDNYVQDGTIDNPHPYLQQEKTKLAGCITALAWKGALGRNEVATELQKTEQLVLEGNKAFYAALPLRIKFLLWWNK